MKAYIGAMSVCCLLLAGLQGIQGRLIVKDEPPFDGLPPEDARKIMYNRAVISNAINRVAAARDYTEGEIDQYARIGRRASEGDSLSLERLRRDGIISQEEAQEVESGLHHSHLAVPDLHDEIHGHLPDDIHGHLHDDIHGHRHHRRHGLPYEDENHRVVRRPDGGEVIHHKHPRGREVVQGEVMEPGALHYHPDMSVEENARHAAIQAEEAIENANEAVAHADMAITRAEVKEKIEEQRKTRELPEDAPKELKEMREYAEVFLAEDHDEEIEDLTRKMARNVHGAEEKRAHLLRKVEIAGQIMQGVFPAREVFTEFFKMNKGKDTRRMMKYVDEVTVDPAVKKSVVNQMVTENKRALHHLVTPQEHAAMEKAETEAFAQKAYENAVKRGLPQPLARLNGKIARVYAEEFGKHLHEGEDVHHAGEAALQKAMEFKGKQTGEKEKTKKGKHMDMKDFIALARHHQKEKEEQLAREKAELARRAAERLRAERIKAQIIKNRMLALEDPSGTHKDAYHNEEEKAAYNDHKKIKEAGKKASENIISHGGTPEEAAHAAQRAQELMKDKLARKRKMKAAEAEKILRNQQLDPAVAHRMAEHLAAAHDEKEEESEKEDKLQNLEITKVIPDTASEVQLNNAVIRLPFDEIPNFKATTEEEVAAKKRQRDLRDKIRNTYTRKRIPSGLPVIKTDKGFLNVAESAKELKITKGKAYFGQGAYNAMREQGIDVSGLTPKIVSEGEGPLGDGSAYYEANVSDMKMQIPTPTNPHPPKLLTNANETLDISQASKMEIQEGKVVMEPMESFSAKIRPAVNAKADTHEEERMAEAAEQLFDEQEKKEASHVDFIKTEGGESIVSITPSYGHSKRMQITEAMDEFGKINDKHESEQEEEMTPLNMAESHNGSRVVHEYLANGLKGQEGAGAAEAAHEEEVTTEGVAADILEHAKESAEALKMDVADFKAAIGSIPNTVFQEAESYYSKLADDPENVQKNLIDLGKQKFYVDFKQRFPNKDMGELLHIIFDSFRKDTGKPNVMFDKLIMKIPIINHPPQQGHPDIHSNIHGVPIIGGPGKVMPRPMPIQASLPPENAAPMPTPSPNYVPNNFTRPGQQNAVRMPINVPHIHTHFHPATMNPAPNHPSSWHAPLINSAKMVRLPMINNRMYTPQPGRR